MAKQLCESHVRATGDYAESLSTQAAIESYLARHIVSVVYAEVEATIRSLVADRVSSSASDPRVTSFSKVASNRIIRSISISDLSGILNHFSPDCKKHFRDSLTSKQQSDWGSLLTTRHDTAHENGGSPQVLTLNDIDEYYNSVAEVLSTFSESLHK